MSTKFSFYTIYLIACTISSYASLSYNIPEEDIAVVQSKNRASLFQTQLPTINMPGKPALPCYNLTFLLPYNADLSTITVKVSGSSEELLPGKYEIEPVGPYISDNRFVWPGVTNCSNGKDMDVYNTDAFFPSGYICNWTTGKMRSYKLIQVTITPYAYNPVTKQLKKISGEKVIIDYKTETLSEQACYAIPDNIKSCAKTLTANYQEFANTYDRICNVRASNSTGYLIITSESIKNSLTSLQTFISGKENHGYSVTVVTETAWGGGTGDQAADNIRNWLTSNYQPLGIEYALMIGDPSGTVAMKRTYPDSKYEPLSDFFFADLSGNWDLDGDGRYGEYSGDFASGGADKHAEIHVGRIPVYGNDIATVDNILNKIATYESEDIDAIGCRFKAFLPEDPFDGYQNGFYYGEAIKNNILVPSGWEYFRVYEDHYGVGAEKYPCTYANVLDSWKTDNWGIVIWQAHGLVTLAQDVMNTSNATQLDDSHPSHVFQTSCHNGRPDASDNLAYAILKNTAVSTIASAVEILYSLNTNYGNGGAGNDFGYVYAKCLVQDSLPAAAAFDKTRSTLPFKSGLDWVNCVELNLYGCPAVGVYTSSGSTDIQNGDIDKHENRMIEVKVINSTNSRRKVLFYLPDIRHYGGSITIYNLQGKSVYTKNISPNAKKLIWNFTSNNNISLSCGIYIASVNLFDISGKTERSMLKLSVQ